MGWDFTCESHRRHAGTIRPDSACAELLSGIDGGELLELADQLTGTQRLHDTLEALTALCSPDHDDEPPQADTSTAD